MTPNIGEDNSTTSGNGQNYVHVDDPDFPQSEITITSTDTSGNVIVNRKKIRTRSYKTELGKMTRQRNVWRFACFFFCAAEILRVIIQHAIQS